MAVINENNLYWFIKYLTGRGSVPYADCDRVSFRVRLHEGKFIVYDIYLTKFYGSSNLLGNGNIGINYEGREYSISSDKKYLPFFKDTDDLSIVYYVSEEKNVLEKRGNIYILRPKKDIPNIESYRMNIIKHGSQYSLKSADAASYIGLELLRVQEYMGSYHIILQDNGTSGGLELSASTSNCIVFSMENLKKALQSDTVNIEKLVAELINKMSDLPRAEDIDTLDTVNQSDWLVYKISRWSPRSKVYLQAWSYTSGVLKYVRKP